MNLLEKLLGKLFKQVDILKMVTGVNEIYLRRWFLGFGPDGRIRWYHGLLRRLMVYGKLITTNDQEPYLHKIFRSDDDPDPHDHPWDFKTLILWNGYNDERYLMTEWYQDQYDRVGPYVEKLKFFDKRFRTALHIHQVKKRNDRPSWTLIIRGPYKREWGFWDEHKFIPSHEYLGLSKDADPYPFDTEMFKV